MSAHELIAPKSAMTSQIACGSAAIVRSRRVSATRAFNRIDVGYL